MNTNAKPRSTHLKRHSRAHAVPDKQPRARAPALPPPPARRVARHGRECAGAHHRSACLIPPCTAFRLCCFLAAGRLAARRRRACLAFAWAHAAQRLQPHGARVRASRPERARSGVRGASRVVATLTRAVRRSWWCASPASSCTRTPTSFTLPSSASLRRRRAAPRAAPCALFPRSAAALRAELRRARRLAPRSCRRCDGTGKLACGKCRGYGYLKKGGEESIKAFRQVGVDQDVSGIYLCPFCKGTGTLPCHSCRGKAKLWPENLNIEVRSKSKASSRHSVTLSSRRER